MSGQSSIIIVLAIVIFFIIVLTFAWQNFLLVGPPEPGSIGELKKLLRDAVEEKIYTGAYETLERIGGQGGYLDVPSPNIDFGLGKVSYWQICQHGFIPSLDNITRDIREGMKRYLNAWEIAEFEGKRVAKSEINSSDVEVVISPKTMVFRVWMHVSIEGYKLDLPLEVQMESSFLSLYSFARDFVEDNLEGRHFETFIASLFYHSYEDTDHISNPNFLPNMGVLTECGQTIYKTWDEVERVISGMVNYALTHIDLWQEPPPESERTFLDYYIPDLNGKRYPEYGVEFFPTGELTQDNLQPSQNPIVITNNKVLHRFVPACRKEYDVRYSWYQPLVVKFTDSVNYSFSFGVLPYIYKSAIGSCSAEVKWNHAENPCEAGNCQARIRVLDTDGNPVEGARASFGACQIGGETDSEGLVEGGIPCGIGELNIYHRNYIFHYDLVGSSEIQDKAITLVEMPLLITHFYKYPVSYEKGACHYSDPFQGYSPGFEGLDCLKDMLCCNYVLDREPARDYVVADFRREDPLPWELDEIYIGNMNPENKTVSAKGIQYLPPGNYSVSSELIDPGKKGTTGLMEGEYELREKPVTRDIYVNIPSYKFLPTFGFDLPEYAYYRERLLGLMSECGIGHVSDNSPPEQCRLYTWCERGVVTRPLLGDFVTLKSCTERNKHLVLDPLLEECGLPISGSPDEKVGILEERCGIRVRFKTPSGMERACNCMI